MEEEIASPRRSEGEAPPRENPLQREANQPGDRQPERSTPTGATPSLPPLEITGAQTGGGSTGDRRSTATASDSNVRTASDTRGDAPAPTTTTPVEPFDRMLVEMDRALARVPEADRRRVGAEVAEVQRQIERIGLRADAENRTPRIPRALMERIERLDRQINQMFEPLKAAIVENAARQGRPIDVRNISFTCAPVGYNGQYAMGEGKLSFRAAPFLPTDGQPYDVNALGTVNHELRHREQDGLLIRRFADELRERGRFSYEALQSLYQSRLNTPLDISLAVYHSMEPELTVEERRRADGLLRSFNDMRTNAEERTRIELSINRVNQGMKYLKEVGVSEFIREAINRNPAQVKTYFGKPTPPEIERHLRAYYERTGFDEAAARRDFDRAMNERRNGLAQEYDQKYKSQPHEREAYAEGDRTTRRAGDLSLSVRPPAAPAVEIADAHRRALEVARTVRAGQPGLNLANRPQVKQLLQSALDSIDEGSTRWAESDRAAVVKLIDDYGKGDAQATRAVHSMLGLSLPADSAPVSPDARAGGPLPDAPQSLRDLERQLEQPARRAELVARMVERGPLRETLIERGMLEDRARQLERDMLSERREVRERAMEEIGRFYRGKGGARAFASEVRGRLGALVLVAAVVLPFVLREAAREADGPDATWR